jgi:hypothetical protein
MSRPKRDRLATPQAVIDDHGGEVQFWLAWINGELEAELQTWFRQQAAQDAVLARDLRSVEQSAGGSFSTQAARELLGAALEGHGYLVEAGGSEQGFTDIAVTEDMNDATDTDSGEPSREFSDAIDDDGGGTAEPQARRVLRPALFGLLEAVEVPVPADEVNEGSRLLTELVGPQAVERFRRLEATVQTIRRRAAEERPPALYRVLRGVVPELFETVRFREGLSYRLYLRARLKHYCRGRSWRPTGPRFSDLTTAFDALTRERIGLILQQLAEPVEELCREGLELATVEFDR